MESPASGEIWPISLSELKKAVVEAEPGALIVRPLVLRRVIREDRRLRGFRWKTPHRKSYVIARQTLLAIVDEVDLELESGRALPERVVLIEQPGEQELGTRPAGEILVRCWRLLFHSRVHLELDRRQISAPALREKIARIGVIEFDEIRSVLAQELFLFSPGDDAAVYAEFAAVYLELRHFAPSFLARYFPGLEDLEAIDALLSQELDAAAMYRATRPRGAPEPVDPFPGEHEVLLAEEAEPDPGDLFPWPAGQSPWLYRLMLVLANRAERRGNLVRSAIYLARALRRAPEGLASKHRAMLKGLVNRLVDRLLTALELRGQSPRRWREPLLALVEQAAGGVWSVEARLLYDLQKVWLDSEREMFTVDPVEWALTWGKRPIRRALPAQREVLMSRHLATAARRLPALRIDDGQRRRLSELLRTAAARAEDQLRRRIGPRVIAALDEVGLAPASLPERVSQKKLAEELLDRIVGRGFAALGDLRDAISRNNVKLPDVAGPGDFLRGDRLLEADRRLAVAIDGVYRRGEFYLRAMQRLSSLAFGTRPGRFFTRYLAVPFGGAYLVLAGLEHVVELLAHRNLHINRPLSFLLLGLFFLGLIYVEPFRRAVGQALSAAGRLVRSAAIDLPLWIAGLPLVRRMLDSRLFLLAEHHVIKPLFWTGVACLVVPFHWTTWPSSVLRLAGVFLGANLMLNSRLGRNLEDTIATWAVESWQRFGVRILTGLFYFIRDLFWAFLQGIERVLYAVDQWLRFRSGQGPGVMVIKGALGVAWFFVTYVVRFCVNLLIEPQINPIKHFPVVTVSHKLLLPLIPSFAGVLALTMEKGFAYTVATMVITSIPGIFGFLVWELKENWRLYAANRPRELGPVLIGHHGETMARLLRPGLHSGTIPKRYARLRRAERRARVAGKWPAVRKHLLALEHVEQSLRRYLEREFLEFFAQSPSWDLCRPEVRRIRISTNQVKATISLSDRPEASLTVQLQTKAGWMVARADDRGLAGPLTREERRVLALAVLGLYKTAGVELACQQLDAELSHPAMYDFRPEGLVVWADPASADAVLYDLHAAGLDHRPRLLFTETRVPWRQWVDAWSAESPGGSGPLTAAALPLLAAPDSNP